FIPFHEDHMQVLFPSGHPIGKLTKLSLQQLAKHPMVMMSTETSARATIDAAFSKAECYPYSACEVMNMMTAVAMVRAGLGFTILPASAIKQLAHPGVSTRLIDDSSSFRRVGIIKKPSRSLSPASELFIPALMKMGKTN